MRTKRKIRKPIKLMTEKELGKALKKMRAELETVRAYSGFKTNQAYQDVEYWKARATGAEKESARLRDLIDTHEAEAESRHAQKAREAIASAEVRASLLSDAIIDFVGAFQALVAFSEQGRK